MSVLRVTDTRSLHRGLVAHYKLDEASGDRLDTVGGHTLTAINTPGSDTGKIGNAATFARANSRMLGILSGSAGDFSPGANPFSIAGWINFTQVTGSPTINAKWDSTNGNRQWMVRRLTGTGVLQFSVTSDGQAGTRADVNGAAITSGIWNFFCVGWDGARIFAQLNNDLRTYTNFAGPVYSGGQAPYLIGAFGLTTSGQEFWNGLIDELRYYNRVLTGAEAARLYNGGNGRSHPSG
jgi:hypothetical protein